MFKKHTESIRNDTGSVVRLVGELSYLDCLQEIYCCVLNSVQQIWTGLAPFSLECDNWRLVRDYFATKIDDINTTFTLQSH